MYLIKLISILSHNALNFVIHKTIPRVLKAKLLSFERNFLLRTRYMYFINVDELYFFHSLLQFDLYHIHISLGPWWWRKGVCGISCASCLSLWWAYFIGHICLAMIIAFLTAHSSIVDKDASPQKDMPWFDAQTKDMVTPGQHSNDVLPFRVHSKAFVPGQGRWGHVRVRQVHGHNCARPQRKALLSLKTNTGWLTARRAQ